MERRERKSPFIHLNDTARPGINCGPFHAMSYYSGCPNRCDYCYLQGTFRGKVTPVVYTNREKALAELDAWLEQPGHLRLNAGELEDSLAMDGGLPIIVFDPEGEYWTLNERYPTLVAGGEHADIPLVRRPRIVRELLSLTLSRSGFALVFDLSELREREQQAKAFAARLMELRSRHARKVSFLDRLDQAGLRTGWALPDGPQDG